MTDNGGALERLHSGGAPITQAARLGFEKEQVEAIRRTVAKDCNDAELVMLLELASRYKLDPFARQIWAAKMGGKDGGRPSVTILVGRDGLLAVAERYPDYRGMQSFPVYSHDGFERTASGEIIHTWKGFPGDVEARGELVGGWAMVKREGREDVFFYAPLHEYMPKKRNDFSPWFKQTSAMIKKCAEANALRIAFNISGLMTEAEFGSVIEAEVIEESAPIDWGDDPEVAARLQRATSALGWREAKIRARLTGLDHEQLLNLAVILEGDLAAEVVVDPE